ncbi:MAG: tRNA 2-selenouridine(34) synthase MnmH, partial [Pseudomonadota bacterium]
GRLRHLRPLIGGDELALWEQLGAQRLMPALFERLMCAHYDPAYARSIARNFPHYGEARKLELQRLDMASMSELARTLHGSDSAH